MLNAARSIANRAEFLAPELNRYAVPLVCIALWNGKRVCNALSGKVHFVQHIFTRRRTNQHVFDRLRHILINRAIKRISSDLCFVVQNDAFARHVANSSTGL